MSTGDKMSTGNAMGGAVASVRGQEEVQSRVRDMMDRMGVPGRLGKSRFASDMAKIDALCGAKTQEQKEAVKDALVYLAIVNGSGPNVQWEDIICAPLGCDEVSMSRIVDGVVTRKYHRRFMTNLSARAIVMYDSSPELQNELTERAVRNGVPITESKAVIDFIDSSSGVSPGMLALRVMAKHSSVARANNNSKSSVEKSAGGAAGAMHGYNDGDVDSLGG